jgi:BASS family bile acid:Na+ symporter
MFLMDPLTKALFYVFLAGSMLGIGLKVGKDEILSVLRDTSWLVRVFVANFILIPAVGILAAKSLAVKPENGLALIVLACAPGGMSALQFLSKKKEAAALAYGAGTTAFLTLLSIFLTPLLLALALPKGMDLTVPYGQAVLFVSLFMLLPLVLGMLVCHLNGPAAGKLAGPISLIATLAFVGIVVKLLNITKWAKGEMGTRGLLAIVAFVLISMLIGWLLGGPRKFTRPVLAAASSMRNIALALAIAIRSFDDPAVMTPLVAFMAIMVPANLVYMLIAKVVGKRRAKPAAA